MAVEAIDQKVNSRDWHVTANTGKLGPLTLVEVAELAASGRIAPRSLAWKSGMASWQPCGMIPELAPLFENVPSPAKVWGTRMRALLSGLRGIEAEVRPHIERMDTGKFRLTSRQWRNLRILLLLLAGIWVWRSFIYVPPHDDLIGLFSGTFPADPRSEFARQSKREGRQAFVVLDAARVEKRDGEYLLYEKFQGKWAGPQKMKPMDDKALSDLFGEEWMELDPLGLVNPTGLTAILRVPQGWEPEDFSCQSGYIILKPSGPVEIMKKEPIPARTSVSAAPVAPGLPALRAKQPPTPQPTVKPQSPTLGQTGKSKGRDSTQTSAESPSKTLTLPPARPKKSAKSSAKARELAPVAPIQKSAAEPQVPAADPSPAATPPVAESTKPIPEKEATPHSEAVAVSVPQPTTSPLIPSPFIKPATEIVPKSKSTPAPTAVPKPASTGLQLESAQKRAEGARARLASLSASGRTTLREEFLKNGDAFMKTSKERAATNDTDGAVFYAERAEATYRQGEQALGGGK